MRKANPIKTVCQWKKRIQQVVCHFEQQTTNTHHAEVDELDVGGGVGEGLLHPGQHEPLDLAGLQGDQLADGFLVLLQRTSGGTAYL